MNIEVKNISYTQATISWSTQESCVKNDYHVVYRPNWNSIFSGYPRHPFHHEEKVPGTLNSLVLRQLAPSTVYFLCITCKNSYPSSNHCTLFHTLDRSSKATHGSQLDPGVSLWMVTALLLACFVAILAFFCLQFWCLRCHEPRWSYHSDQQEEVDELVRWAEGVPGLGRREEDLQGFPMTALLTKSSSGMTENSHSSPSTCFSPKGTHDHAVIFPHCGP
ncbi:fibronectin type III domain-containing protein 9 [Gracilinanus agilis]|uniref:fibronectin type III domain-containing protein 9 n=1 Tax=Gracilinanus agilis TaxID=191870 RepID=UPI001CFE999B|nr:fibronectin type III domain-containing protein 9 [Gracilinanus agilis]